MGIWYHFWLRLANVAGIVNVNTIRQKMFFDLGSLKSLKRLENRRDHCHEDGARLSIGTQTTPVHRTRLLDH